MTITIKIEHCKISKLLNDSTRSKFVRKKGLNYMIYQGVSILLTRIWGLKLQY